MGFSVNCFRGNAIKEDFNKRAREWKKHLDQGKQY